MITRFKIFESNEEPIEIGDYVICSESPSDTRIVLKHKVWFDFLQNNIGQVIRIEKIGYNKTNLIGSPNYNPELCYYITYENIPQKYKSWFQFHEEMDRKFYDCRPFAENEIAHWSKNKEELETILSAKNYNL
jgi:hypothetical protein